MSDQVFNDVEEFKSVKQTLNESSTPTSTESQVETNSNDDNDISSIIAKNDSNDVDDKDINDLELPDVKDKSKLPDWVEERIKIKNKKIAARDAEIEELKNKLNQVVSSNNPNYKDNYVPSNVLPSRDDFDSENEWVSAVVEHKLKENEYHQRLISQQQQQEIELKTHLNRVDEKIAKGEKKYQDFEEITAPLFSDSFPVNSVLSKEVFGSDYAEDLLYFFGKYPDKAREIALMPPQKVIRKIYDLERRFEEASKKTSPKEGYSPSPKIKSGESGSDLSWESMANMSQEDFDKAYEKKFFNKKIW